MQGRQLPRGSSYVTPRTDDTFDPNDNNDNNDNLEDLNDDGRSVIGVSLGPEQTKLAAPSATDQQKQEALRRNLGEGDVVQDEQRYEEPGQLDTSQSASSHETPVVDKDFAQPGTLPSPWRAGPKSDWTSLDGARERNGSSQSGARQVEASREEAGWRRYIPSLPSIPKSFSNASRSSTSSSASPVRSRASTLQSRQRSNPSTEATSLTSSTSREHHVHNDGDSRHAASTYQSIMPQRTQPEAPRPSPLRRTTSDGSLYLQRSLSRASSLGDDSRWTDVHQQVNSRAKAIKDSIADSNFRLPRMPEIPSFNIGEALADFQATRKRSSSILGGRSKRQESPSKVSRDAQAMQSQQTRGADRNVEISPPPGMTKANAESHPNFTRALKNMKGDLVIMGGYRGSILRTADAPHRQVWVPVKVGLGIRKVNLDVGFEPNDEAHSEDYIIPDGMLKNIGPVDISRRLFKRLAACKNAQDRSLRVWDFGYDWRLSPHRLSDQLLEFLETLPCNSSDTPPSERGATVIAHSLGGLITRHVVNRRPDLFRGVLYAGTPQTCVNILGPLRNGDEVLLSSRVLTAQVNLSIRTSFALLPLDGKCFFNRDTEERFDVDFFDPKQWEEYCWSPCVSRPIPLASKPQTSTLGGMVGSVSNMLPSVSLPGRSSKTKRDRQNSGPPASLSPGGHHAVSMQMDRREEPTELGEDPQTAPSTHVTISKDTAMRYLTRTLAEVKRFKEELAFDPAIDARGDYPPAALIYGKAIPTVYGACVKDRESIKNADAYDDLAFASGDGVVLARAAQLPEGYKATKGGVVSSDRGHISLLGDLEAVGRCLNALRAERKKIQRGEGKKPADDGSPEEDVGQPTAGIE